MVEHAMGEDNIKALVGEGQIESAGTFKPRIIEPSAAEPGRNPVHGFSGDIDPRPDCPSSDDLFRVSTLSQPNLKNLLTLEIDSIQAAQNMGFPLVPKRIVAAKEILVVGAQCLHLALTARMSIPELADRLFVHFVHQILVLGYKLSTYRCAEFPVYWHSNPAIFR